MKKVVVIWDLHGLNVWKKIDISSFDKVVFLWDYVDSFIVPDSDMIKNLQEIIQLKKDNMDKVELLLGNHDIQYIWDWNDCSWKRPRIAHILSLLYKENLDLFKIAHEEDIYLFTHAWVTDDWFNSHQMELEMFGWDTLWEVLNRNLSTRNRKLLFMCWPERGGPNVCSWPLWADRNETTKDGRFPGIIQVVWHTPVNKIIRLPHIIYCDTLERGSWEFLELEIEQ